MCHPAYFRFLLLVPVLNWLLSLQCGNVTFVDLMFRVPFKDGASATKLHVRCLVNQWFRLDALHKTGITLGKCLRTEIGPNCKPEIVRLRFSDIFVK
jgi:hypothetical protein